jgi:hypothetical protein
MHAFGVQIVPNHFEDKAGGQAFLDKIAEELRDPQYELFCKLYIPSGQLLTGSYVSYGRKP